MRLTDVHRSLRRWASLILTDPWTVTLAEDRVAIPVNSRPFAVVQPAGPGVTAFARSSIPQGDVRRSQNMAVTAFPVAVDTPAGAVVAAEELADYLLNAVDYGLVDGDGAVLTGPRAVPLWDYSGVPATGAGRAGPPAPITVAEVEGHTVRPLPDPSDDRLWSVTLSLSLTWWAPGRLRANAAEEPIVTSIPGTFSP